MTVDTTKGLFILEGLGWGRKIQVDPCLKDETIVSTVCSMRHGRSKWIGIQGLNVNPNKKAIVHSEEKMRMTIYYKDQNSKFFFRKIKIDKVFGFLEFFPSK